MIDWVVKYRDSVFCPKSLSSVSGKIKINLSSNILFVTGLPQRCLLKQPRRKRQQSKLNLK